MATETKTINAGPVGMKPKGDYNAATTYTLLDCVKHNHDSWVCTALNADGTAAEVTGQEPKDGSQYWKALTDGGRAAYAEGENAAAKAAAANTAAGLANEKALLANEKAGLANEKAGLAVEKAGYATQQGDYAKAQGDYAKRRGDYPDQIRSDGYIYTYDPDNAQAGEDGYVKTDRHVVAGLDLSALTPEQRQELIDEIQADLVFASDSTCEDIITELV